MPMANLSRFLNSEDTVAMKYACKLDEHGKLIPIRPYDEDYSVPKIYMSGNWCVVKQDDQGRYYADPVNTDNPMHPEAGDED